MKAIVGYVEENERSTSYFELSRTILESEEHRRDQSRRVTLVGPDLSGEPEKRSIDVVHWGSLDIGHSTLCHERANVEAESDDETR